MERRLALLLVAVCCICGIVEGWGDRANCDATVSAVSPMGGPSSSGNGGYSIKLSNSSYVTGSYLQVTLSGASTFRGFLLYGVDGKGNRVGGFANLGSGSQYLSCSGGSQATICHTSSSNKGPSLSFNWVPPPAGSGTVTFNAVVCLTQNNWYVLNTVTAGDSNTTVAGGGVGLPPTVSASGPSSYVPSHSVLAVVGVAAAASSWIPIVA